MRSKHETPFQFALYLNLPRRESDGAAIQQVNNAEVTLEVIEGRLCDRALTIMRHVDVVKGDVRHRRRAPYRSSSSFKSTAGFALARRAAALALRVSIAFRVTVYSGIPSAACLATISR